MKEPKNSDLTTLEEVFISYAWGGKSEEIVEKLESICQAKQIERFKTLRDQGEIGYKGQILEFMKRLGQGKAIIIIISEKYLKSKNCMFELLEIAQNGQFYQRIFPIVTQDSKIYNAIEKIRYLQYWEEKHSELDNEYRKLQSMSNTLGIQEELSLYSDIRNKWDQLIDVISKMNNLSVDDHLESDFAQVIKAIEDRLQDSQNSKKKDELDCSIPQNLKNSGIAKFVGRETVLNELCNKLEKAEIVAISTLSGMGGIGKTELALRYAWQEYKKGTYQGGICWVNVKGNDPSADIISFFNIKLKLGKPSGITPVEKVQDCWQNWINGDVLIIFDDVRNAEEIFEYLPPYEFKKFKVIITTRCKYLSDTIDNIPLEELSEEASLDLLRSYVGNERINEQLEESKLLCQDLGYLPLALELIARLLKRRRWTIKKAREKLKERGLKDNSLLSKPHTEMTAKYGVKVAFDLSWYELENEPETNKIQNLALSLSLFAIAPIQQTWINELFPNEDEDDIEEWLIDSLVNLNLVKRIADTEYELHSLIHLYLREKLDESKFMLRAKQDYCKLLVEKSERFISTRLSPEKIEELKPLIPHIKQITQSHYDYIVDDYDSIIPSDWNLPIKAINSFYISQGFYPQAIQYFREYIDITKNKFGEGDIHLMVLYNDFSLDLKDIGEYNQALTSLEKALSIAIKCLGKNHHETMMITNAIGDTYRQMEKYEEAEKILTTLYYSIINWMFSNRNSINTESNDEKEIDKKLTIFVLVNNNLALVYQSIEKYQEAENCYKLILDRLRKNIQDKSSFAQGIFTQSANNLGSLYIYMKRYEEAEYYLVQALAINKRILDPKHLNYRLGISYLARLYIIEDRLDEAEKIVVELFELQLQLDYLEPTALKELQGIASQYFYKGLYEKLEQISLKINHLYQKFQLTESIEYCESLNLLAKSYLHVQKTEEAITLAKEAIDIGKKLLSKSSKTKITISSATSLNIVIANSFNALGLAFWHLSQKLKTPPQLSQRKQFLLQAERCTKYSLELCKIDENSHDKEIKSMVSNIHNNLGLILEDLEKYLEAEKSYRISLQLRREELGDESYVVGQSLLNLAACYDWQEKNNDQTEKMLLECKSIWEKLIKPDHPEMVHCYEHLGKLYNRTRQFKKAIDFYEKAVENCRVREDKNIYYYQQKLEECIKRSKKVKSKKSSKSSKKPKGFG